MDSDYKASVLYFNIARQYAITRRINAQALNRILPDQAILEGDNHKVPLPQILDFWRQAADLCADPAFGLHAGKHCHLSDYAIFSHLLMTCPNLIEALQLVTEHLHIMNEGLENNLTTGSGLSCYSLECLYKHPASIHHIEHHFASIIQLGRQIVQQNDQGKIRCHRVEFSHSPTAPMREYEEIFQCEVLFEGSGNQLILPRELLLTPTHSPNKGLYSHLLKLVNSISLAGSHQKKFTEKVYAALNAKGKWHSWPTLNEVANTIGVSPSSLKRKLKQEQSSYQAICDKLRYRQAKHILTVLGRTVSETAHQLGFSSPASFSRSFKRWSGQSPIDYLSGIKPATSDRQPCD